MLPHDCLLDGCVYRRLCRFSSVKAGVVVRGRTKPEQDEESNEAYYYSPPLPRDASFHAHAALKLDAPAPRADHSLSVAEQPIWGKGTVVLERIQKVAEIE